MFGRASDKKKEAVAVIVLSFLSFLFFFKMRQLRFNGRYTKKPKHADADLVHVKQQRAVRATQKRFH
jgi:hypothetical protein